MSLEQVIGFGGCKDFPYLILFLPWISPKGMIGSVRVGTGLDNPSYSSSPVSPKAANPAADQWRWREGNGQAATSLK